MTAYKGLTVLENDQKRSIRGTTRALQGALSIAKDAKSSAARNDIHHGRIPIGTAAAAGRLIEVEQLLDSGVNVNEQDSFGETALHLACMEGQYKVVRMLVVEQQARVDLQNWEGWVPMIWAIVRGHIQIVKFLSERGSSLQWKSYLGWTALHFAAIQGDLELVDWLLEEGADALATGDDGCMPGDCASNSAVRKTLYKTVAHQKLSAGEDQRSVRAFLEGRRMSHILDHDDLHQTLAQLPDRSVAPRVSALTAARAAGRLSTASRMGRARSSRLASALLGSSKGGRGGACGGAGDRSPSVERRQPAASAAAPAATALEEYPSAMTAVDGAAPAQAADGAAGERRAAEGGGRVDVADDSAADADCSWPELLQRDEGLALGAHCAKADAAGGECGNRFEEYGRRSTFGQAVRFNDADVQLASDIVANTRRPEVDEATAAPRMSLLFTESADGEDVQVPLLMSRIAPADELSDFVRTNSERAGAYTAVACGQMELRHVGAATAKWNSATAIAARQPEADQLEPRELPPGHCSHGSVSSAEDVIINEFLGGMQSLEGTGVA
eukprot:jgi/Ulvmu1/11256/UM073_0028.1